MSAATTYEITHDADGWWEVYRKGRFVEDFLTREDAERGIERFRREDEENEREAREDAERDEALQRMADESHEEWVRDDRMDRGDWEFHRDHDQ